MVYFFIPGEPVAQGRPRFRRIGKGVSTYDPEKSRVWKKHVEAVASQNISTPFERGVPLAISMLFIFTRPKSVKRTFHIVRPDLDNFCKGTLDGLKNAWFDDAQVVKISARKQYGDEAGVTIRIQEDKQ